MNTSKGFSKTGLDLHGHRVNPACIHNFLVRVEIAWGKATDRAVKNSGPLLDAMLLATGDLQRAIILEKLRIEKEQYQRALRRVWIIITQTGTERTPYEVG
jgi:hypothetical protein